MGRRKRFLLEPTGSDLNDIPFGIMAVADTNAPKLPLSLGLVQRPAQLRGHGASRGNARD
jgi:hypothetical protein